MASVYVCVQGNVDISNCWNILVTGFCELCMVPIGWKLQTEKFNDYFSPWKIRDITKMREYSWRRILCISITF